jgi:iron complex outermembrane receptor protein
MRPILPPALALACFAAGIAPVAAQTDDGDALFELGEIVVVGQRPDALSSVGGSVVTREQTWTFQKVSLDQALDLAPGVSTTIRGRRNESDVFVRGFGRWQVPLMVDGVRIYLPADNRIDFGRFLTADIEAVQIQKGYASVLDGPGAMGGAINLVTSKPTGPFEAEGGASLGASGVDGSQRILDGRRAAGGLLRAGQRDLRRTRLLGSVRRLHARTGLARRRGRAPRFRQPGLAPQFQARLHTERYR